MDFFDFSSYRPHKRHVTNATNATLNVLIDIQDFEKERTPFRSQFISRLKRCRYRSHEHPPAQCACPLLDFYKVNQVIMYCIRSIERLSLEFSNERKPTDILRVVYADYAVAETVCSPQAPKNSVFLLPFQPGTSLAGVKLHQQPPKFPGPIGPGPSPLVPWDHPLVP